MFKSALSIHKHINDGINKVLWNMKGSLHNANYDKVTEQEHSTVQTLAK